MIPGTVAKVCDVLGFVCESLGRLQGLGDYQTQVVHRLIVLLEGQIQFLQDSMTNEEVKAELDFLGIDMAKTHNLLKEILKGRPVNDPQQASFDDNLSGQ